MEDLTGRIIYRNRHGRRGLLNAYIDEYKKPMYASLHYPAGGWWNKPDTKGYYWWINHRRLNFGPYISVDAAKAALESGEWENLEGVTTKKLIAPYVDIKLRKLWEKRGYI